LTTILKGGKKTCTVHNGTLTDVLCRHAEQHNESGWTLQQKPMENAWIPNIQQERKQLCTSKASDKEHFASINYYIDNLSSLKHTHVKRIQAASIRKQGRIYGATSERYNGWW